MSGVSWRKIQEESFKPPFPSLARDSKAIKNPANENVASFFSLDEPRRCLDVLLDNIKRNSRVSYFRLLQLGRTSWCRIHCSLAVCVCVCRFSRQLNTLARCHILPSLSISSRIFQDSSPFLSGGLQVLLRRSTITCPISWHGRELHSGRDRGYGRVDIDEEFVQRAAALERHF